eukprot:NODE_581_length_798_cov_90.786382_g517_i0.p1 GENE.NODE_581_length_798_cov_90.786382_g517_i0~~NODE_581_length_798_cov_90.786382_g517_i0.p1  ORF type:complete len:229 (+),score=34.94 NODE_581_length_798_cov_90.786382_g517_i0:77-763(+)
MLNVKTIHVKTPYLHPSHRNLKSEQIGPSSHKNEYNVGVLQGDFWVEDRAAFDQKYTNVPLEATTIMKASFQNPGTHAPVQKTTPIPQGEMDKQLMFGHGKDFHESSYITMNELMYADPGAMPEALKTDIVVKVQGGSLRRRFADAKKSQWQIENTEADRFVTSKKATIDATADQVTQATTQRELQNGKAPTQKWGSAVKSLSSDHHKTGLRGGVTLTRSPLVQRGFR